MTTLGSRQWDTSRWVGKERLNAPPNWHGVSPRVIARRGRPWNQDPNSGPWLDQPGALEAIERRRSEGLISDEEAVMLEQWMTQGYFIVRGAIEPSEFPTLDAFCRDLDDLWTTDRELPGLQVLSLHIKGRPPGPIDHAEILSWPLAERIARRDSQLWRIHFYHHYSAAAMALSKADRILRMVSLILDDDPALLSYIGFKWGSEVGPHQDLAANHIHPAHRLVGVWLAAEDVDPAAGPLGVFPGSHRVPSWPGWVNYPQTNLRTCHLDTRIKEEEYLRKAVDGKVRIAIPVSKGDAIFTHGLLVHGGNKIETRGITRFSSVLHYTVPGGDRCHEVEGPFNW